MRKKALPTQRSHFVEHGTIETIATANDNNIALFRHQEFRGTWHGTTRRSRRRKGRTYAGQNNRQAWAHMRPNPLSKFQGLMIETRAPHEGNGRHHEVSFIGSRARTRERQQGIGLAPPFRVSNVNVTRVPTQGPL